MLAVPGFHAAILGGAFSPRSLPGLQLWLDASAITGLSDGDPIATWSDLSGKGNDATQATSSKRPVYKVAIINGQAVGQSDGVDDVLACANLTKAVIPTTSDVTLALVFQLTGGAGAAKQLFYLGNASGLSPSDHGIWLQKLADNTLVFNGYDGSEHRAISNAAVSVGTTYIAVGVRESGVNKLYLNGALQTTTAAAGTPNVHATATLSLFAGQGGYVPAPVYIGGAVACTQALSASQALRLSRYWGLKLGVAVS